MTAERALTPEVLGSLIFMLTVTVLFGEHARHAFVDWREQRTGQTLRVMVIGVSLALSLIALLVSTLYRAGLVPFDVSTFTSYIVRGALIVAGIFDVLSWHAERRRGA